MKHNNRAIAILLGVVLAGCENGPEQGPGELWLYERGEPRCVNVVHITFYAAHWTVYTTEDGTKHNVPGPFEYYKGKRCEANTETKDNGDEG